MSEKSIKRMKQRFTLYAMLSLFLVMLMIGGLIFASNYFLTYRNIVSILDYIVTQEEKIGSSYSEENFSTDSEEFQIDSEHIDYDVIRFLSEIFHNSAQDPSSPEARLTNKYFVVLMDENEEVTDIRVHGLSELSAEEATAYGKLALERRLSVGKEENYYYRVKRYEDGTSMVVYLDSTYQMAITSRLLYIALILIGFGFIVAFIFVRLFASKAVQPEIRNAQMQKSFITNASHELKTPLAVIKANTEMQEILEGETEWTQSTLRQVDRLTGLVQNLVMIARSQEREENAEAVEINLSVPVSETVDAFSPVAIQAGRTLNRNIPEQVTLRANDSQVRQLLSLLLDNAIKYCDDGGIITVTLAQKGKNAVLTVSNSYEEGKNVDYKRFFERFYREDQSHNTETGGYGVGLSIAQNLTEQYHGKLDVSWKNGVIFFTCLLKPF